MLDGASLLDGLFERTARLEMPAIAMTDHGNLHGAFDFWSKARAHGVKPIIGLEAYLTPGTRREERRRVRWGRGDLAEEGGDDVAGGGAYTHMTMWASSTEGMHNLFRLASRSSIEGFYYKPRADRELLNQYAEGLIASTGCPSGEVQTRLRLGQYDEARTAAAEYQEIFGKENFFLELMDHDIEIEKRTRDDLLRLGKELGIPPLATNDSHYNNPEDADAQDALICVASGKRALRHQPAQVRRRRLLHQVRRRDARAVGRQERHARGVRQHPAGRRALRGRVHRVRSAATWPAPTYPPAQSEESWFREEVWRGIEARYPGERFTQDVRDRVEMELGVIAAKGYCGYYLVVADFINWAKANGIRVGPGRGSGAGSIAAYALRITDLCPLEHGLIFERFLNPERPSMPDFDIDFDERRRGEVIQYVSDKYGSDRVAQIATFGRLKAKAAVKDAARVLDYGFAMGERITKAMPPDVMGKGVSLKDIFDSSHKRYGDGCGVPLAARGRRRGAPDLRHRGRPRGPDPPVGRARRGRDHVQHAADRHRPDHEARAGRRDHHPVRLPDVRGARAGQDGLPRAAQPDRPRRRAGEHPRQPRRGGGARGADLRRPARPTSCSRAATPSASSSSTAARCGRCCAACGPTSSRTSPPSGALYRPGPMGADSHNKYARRKNGREPIDPIHPDLAEALDAGAGGDLRADRLPGAGDGDRPGRWRASRSDRPTTCAAPWARRRSPSSTSSTPGSRPACWSAASPRPRSPCCGRSCCPSPTTPSTRPTPRRTP